MKTIKVPQKDELSVESQAILDGIEKKMGSIPNLYATIAYSSSALKAMLDAESTLSHQSSFSAKEREAINLIVSQVNECDYCLAAHTAMAQGRGFSEDDTLAIRRAEYQDKKLNAVIKLAQSIANNKGEAGEAVLENFFTAGYNEKALIELTALVALRSFTNYVFANTQIPIDFPVAQAI
ncbi:putative peroxidase-related enzyme [Chryseobacterium ginsenosidimutans]|uniref:carboxymuconolactone decarboxylase family protein n=1 Tax=Chryseobacterium ginsenosidimutans TaxID=687846 RepID=UPI0027830D1D|nr:carboxymuconolactone decarboxylase family protein [Chryseobacterium ginsenosidimutans]MDQ0593637.1 putative peroxidase-related enzyme [Chryseobacterium ginsenosidimutans]